MPNIFSLFHTFYQFSWRKCVIRYFINFHDVNWLTVSCLWPLVTYCNWNFKIQHLHFLLLVLSILAPSGCTFFTFNFRKLIMHFDTECSFVGEARLRVLYLCLYFYRQMGWSWIWFKSTGLIFYGLPVSTLKSAL